MVKITNGTDVIEVTRGAYNEIYSRQGYKVVNEKKPAGGSNNNPPPPPDMTNDEKFIEVMLETPISQWKKEEIKRFATLKEIDISEVKNAGEAKDIIKKFLDDNQN